MRLRKDSSFAPLRPLGAGQHGVSLIELMVAMAIGVVLILGLVQIFGASRAAFATAEGASRIQENSRFALDFFRRDLRMAGHMGFSNERAYVSAPGLMFNHAVAPSTNFTSAPFALRIDMPIQGYEYTGTAPSGLVNLTGGLGGSGGPGAYGPGLPAQLGALMTDAVAFSDIVVLRFLAADRTAGRVLTNMGQLTLENPAADTSFFEPGQFYAVSNRRQISLFQALAAGNPVNVGQGGLNASDWGGLPAAGQIEENLRSFAYRYEYLVYYIGFDALSGEPSLKLRRFAPGAAGLLSGPETLVEGVESMQLVYGVDAGPVRDDVLDQYRVATDVLSLDPAPPEAWRRVLNVRVSLLMRSPQPAAAPLSDTPAPIRVADTVFQVPNDGRVRQAYETVVTLRNRVRN